MTKLSIDKDGKALAS